ncbi:bifunctional diguanylate cyclase/phosphodiesterase [Paracraurococcus lichenis]|uniref:EAL domain-containing protein n=1 Tax=Paracraurococcus lichenis TaxID=3064888 RepID=A0ABT9E7C9_9PROT|nr:EAL domain-containing protein [Paracraurococcus sp. LOR1-02]MDO9711855.1 EAL domain-containing protein [Paracraurococcus sp. LOR1-02]
MRSLPALVQQFASRIHASIWRGVFGLVLGLGLAVGTGAYLMQQREAALRDAEREVRNLSLVLASSVQDSFRSVEMMQTGILEWLRAEGLDQPDSFADAVPNRAVHAALRARTAALPMVRTVFLTDAKGRTLATNRVWPAPDVAVAERDYFRAIADDPEQDNYLSVPLRNAVDSVWSLFVARRVTSAEGQFLGVLVAVITLDHFEGFFGSVALDASSSIALHRRDGVLLVRYPRVENRIGSSTAGSPLHQRLPQAGQGTALRARSEVDGMERILGAQVAQAYPLYVVATRTSEGVLAPWHREARRLGLGLLLLEGLILAAILLANRHDRQRRALRHLGAAHAEAEAKLALADERERAARALAEQEKALRASEALLRLGMEIGHIGTFSHDIAAGEDVHFAPEARTLLGMPLDGAPVPFETWLALLLPEDQERILHQFGEIFAQRLPTAALNYRIRHAVSGKVRHIECRTRHEYDAEGKTTQVVGVVIDVTANREAEALIRLSLEIGRIGSFRYDFAAGSVQCGAETRAMCGLPAGEVPMPPEEWLAPVLAEDRARILAEIGRVTTDRDTDLAIDYRSRDPRDGSLRHFEVRARVESDPEGQPLSALGVVIDITERREAEARIAHLAQHDVLTGLPNRSLFRDRLDAAIARAQRGEGFAVFCLDLDRFKEVNDTLGHPIGDALLRAVTARLQHELRETDTLARLGGDEFAIIEADVDRPGDATALADRLVAAIRKPFELDDHQVVVGTSIGIAVAPQDGLDPDTLLKGADMALYRAKADGRGRWRFFEAEMDARMQLRRGLEMDLRRALVLNEFELFYQPIMDVASRRVSGFEALIRWRHPERGLVPPDAFIPLAEEIGLIVPLGEWVLVQACRQAVSWPGAPKVAVNLSPVQFASRGLVDAVAAALEASGLEAGRLELEITETVMLQDTEATLATLHRLKALGVRIAMDDFGTGYSSLGYLQRFPFDKVKIDRSFTRGLEQSRQSNAIVRAVTDLCAGLEMTTTAEGVETEEQFAALLRKGCQEAQGYLFSKPRPAAEVPGLLDRLERDAKVEPAAE